MNYNEFGKKVKYYLGNNYNPGNAGKWVNNKTKEVIYHKHILEIPEGKTQKDIVIESNLLGKAKETSFFDNIKLHPDAHHLNSSQIMCYNFFRPLISDNKTPLPVLISILRKWCPKLEYQTPLCCEFEFQEKGERTNFDFYLKCGEVKVYCEIKYTETNFSEKGGGKNPHKQYLSIYEPMINESQELWTDNVTEEAVMEQHFQLFRNAIRAKDKNNYVLYICPKDREDLEESFNCFKSKYLNKNIDRIKYVYWENLIKIAELNHLDMTSFVDKYFGYKKANPDASNSHCLHQATSG